MSKKLRKTLQDYLSKIKKPTSQIQLPSNSFSSSKSWILSGCKHPKTLSFAIDSKHEDADKDDAATLADVDRFLFENFRSLYLKDDDDIDVKGGNIVHEGLNSNAVLPESPRFTDTPPDLCGSHRFFVAPGSSGSLIDEARTSMMTTSEDAGSSSTSTTTLSGFKTNLHDGGKDNMSIPNDCIAVLRYSPSPYDDFRQSMQEMIEPRLKNRGDVDWDFMEELLFCYLNLNEKKSYKYILSAFTDMITVLRQNSHRAPAKPRSVQRV